MPKKKGKKKFDVYLTPDEVRQTKQDIQELENMLKADELSGRNLITDKALFNAQITNKKKILRKHSAKKFKSDLEANKAYARAKELEKKIKEAMPKANDYFRKYPSGKTPVNSDFDFERTVRQQIEFQTNPDIKRSVSEYKSIMRRLDPSNPAITNIEALRQ